MIDSALLKQVGERLDVAESNGAAISSTADFCLSMLIGGSDRDELRLKDVSEDNRHNLFDWLIDQISADDADFLIKGFQMRGFNISLYAPGTLMSWAEWKAL